LLQVGAAVLHLLAAAVLASLVRTLRVLQAVMAVTALATV
jgi:hypothetical protein